MDPVVSGLLFVDTTRMWRCLFASTIAVFFVACSSKENGKNPADDFFINKAKWASAKSDIRQYRVINFQSGMTGYRQSTAVFDADTGLIVSCELEDRSWQDSSPTVSDCITQTEYHQNVESYFSYLADLISTNDLSEYRFDDNYGVPVFALGSNMPSCADCSKAGFKITFEVVP